MADIFNFTIAASQGPDADRAGGLTAAQQAFAAALRARYDENRQALEAGDIERVLDFFTDDAMWIGNGLPTRRGREELRLLFQEVAGTARVSLRSLAAHVDGSSGWNFADFHVVPNDRMIAPWTFRTSFNWVEDARGWRCNGVLCFPLSDEPEGEEGP